MTKTTGILALVLGGALTACYPEGPDAAFSDWDDDADRYIDDEEFHTRVTSNGVYDEWDADDDGRLDEVELAGGAFETWDADGDRLLDEEELATANPDFDGELGELADWDANEDRAVDEEELRAGLSSSVYRDWGGDEEGLSERDFTRGLFDAWDLDDDGYLDEDEFRRWNESGWAG